MIKNGQNILVLTSSSTGNNVFMTPAIKLLRKKLPDSMIEVVTLSKLSAEVYNANPYINRLHVIKKASAFDKLAASFDHVIPLHPNTIKKYKSIKTEIHALPKINNEHHHADLLLNHVANLLNTKVDIADRQYFLGNPSKNFIISKSFYKNKPIINMHLGSARANLHGWKFWHYKRAEEEKVWNVENYITLGKKLLELHPNLKITLTGSKNESFLAKRLLKKIPSAIDLTGKTTVQDLLSHISHCDLFISHDCGVLHIASATNTPIIALFGPTSSVRTGPYPDRPDNILIKKERMSDIKVSDVIESVNKSLTQKKQKVVISNHI
jgi:ADP-heptose:LPS heptosyltransferase